VAAVLFLAVAPAGAEEPRDPPEVDAAHAVPDAELLRDLEILQNGEVFLNREAWRQLGIIEWLRRFGVMQSLQGGTAGRAVPRAR
jgi:hypothetical protein